MNPTSFPFLPWLLLFLLGVLLSFLSNHFFIGFTVLLSLGLLFFYTVQPPWFKRSLIIGPCFFFLGFASLIWLFIAPLPQIIIDALDFGVSQLNRFVLWINTQDAFFMNNLFMDELSLVLSYFFLGSLLFWYYFRKEGGLFFCGILLLELMYSMFVGLLQNKQGVWLAHRFGATVLIEHQNNQLQFYSNDTLTKEDFTVKHYQNYFGERSTEMLPLKNSYTINNAELLVVDGAWIESFKPVSNGICYFTTTPK